MICSYLWNNSQYNNWCPSLIRVSCRETLICFLNPSLEGMGNSEELKVMCNKNRPEMLVMKILGNHSSGATPSAVSLPCFCLREMLLLYQIQSLGIRWRQLKM